MNIEALLQQTRGARKYLVRRCCRHDNQVDRFLVDARRFDGPPRRALREINRMLPPGRDPALTHARACDNPFIRRVDHFF